MAIKQLRTNLGEIFLVNPDDDQTIAYVRAEVGRIANLRNPGHFLFDALAGNRLCVETRGAVLSLEDDEEGTIALTLRTEAALLENEDSLEAVLEDFSQTLYDWRNRLAQEPTIRDEQKTEAL